MPTLTKTGSESAPSASAKAAEPVFMSLEEAGRRYLGVSRARAWAMAKAGLLPAFRLGRRWYVSKAAMEQLDQDAIERMRQAQAEQ